MAWRAARSLLVLHQQLKAGAPRARPPATGEDEWGLIGDAAHDPTSDHTPHNFPGWGSNIVTAADFPNRPDLGLDAHRVLDDIRRSRDNRVKYGISNGQMFSSYAVRGFDAWAWRPYNPKNGDKHFTHGHLSVVGDARADGTQPWRTIGAGTADELEEDEMGASFGPIDIQLEGFTSLTIPPVNGGVADPRPAWLNLCNDTGFTTYGLRIWCTKGDQGWQPVPGTDANGLIAIKSGQRVSLSLPDQTGGVSIKRKAIDANGAVVDPTEELPAYAGHLTCAIERGPVSR
ncbi:hypothetical protein [Dactylosporangium sp. CA-139066]|uniref:hypothetical protein n=1 Tax=Dactylosporangium sp. CA-139066 TaxID=3239930 RepID=UPI003D905B82